MVCAPFRLERPGCDSPETLPCRTGRRDEHRAGLHHKIRISAIPTLHCAERHGEAHHRKSGQNHGIIEGV